MADVQTTLARYQRGVQGGSAAYQEGVRGKGAKWQTAATSDAAEQRFAAGMQRAIADKARQKGVQAVSGADWETAAVNLGAQGYAGAAAKAAQNYSKVVQTVVDAGNAAATAAAAIPGTTLAERLQRGPAAATAVHRLWRQKQGRTPEV